MKTGSPPEREAVEPGARCSSHNLTPARSDECIKIANCDAHEGSNLVRCHSPFVDEAANVSRRGGEIGGGSGDVEQL